MLKDISNLGIALNKIEQKLINGGDSICNGSTCATYDYPYGIEVTNEQFYTIPPQFRCCVKSGAF
ncbi:MULTISPECIES: hypothetical protein [unclassified Tenacibaculum]|uniref:hypothetical protein n=1 Tax=unclassified Tenacibaculum TaxID=2635139 RepID=UPI001F18773A|nr:MULTISPECIES: hypothetical protein [unclassified Tenacibaculum]MCF2874060.1 hypothetical protein [Tenacibaculum sp. Cn5-1]MCF2934641.1 hypothetical protein [Tenacibaculum sp. Cn5-34]MCG7510851.1 hypothetical protein [Tenacibaculum sp. Cn5-46]